MEEIDPAVARHEKGECNDGRRAGARPGHGGHVILGGYR